MNKYQDPEERDRLVTQIRRHYNILLFTLALLGVGFTLLINPPQWFLAEEEMGAETTPVDVIENGIHLSSGLIADNGFEIVATTCGACHSLNLVTQNRATRDGWKEIIRWMQEKEKLWDLGANENTILDYLAKNYAPQRKGRRAQLTNIEWYDL